MRLLYFQEDGVSLSLAHYLGSDIPPYAILSHTWGSDDDEVTFADLQQGFDAYKEKLGIRKILFCGTQAAKDGLKYFWVDTCCIDKASSAELSEGINSMFRWYQDAERCYVYLSDVSTARPDDPAEHSERWKPAFKKSRWFSRGWTLEELIAPSSVKFFSRDEALLGDKRSLEQTIYEITGIAIAALRGGSLSEFTKEERLTWSAKRKTKREEDEAYCLFGIFDFQIPILYGERREKAMRRLMEEIEKYPKMKVPVIRAKGKKALSEEEKQTLLESLRFDQIDARRETIKTAHVSTCKWLLQRPEYMDWLDATKAHEHNGFLWIKGKPGVGKSTLMKFALANTEDVMEDAAVISFFFNARGDDLEKSTVGTYRSLLLQLLEQVSNLQNIFDLLRFSPGSIKSSYKWSVESLQTLLENAIRGLGSTPLICFVDALDECEYHQIREMVSFLARLGETAVSNGIKFNICLSSRHYPHISIRKGISLVLEGQTGHIQDIKHYIETELRIGETELADQIKSEVQHRSYGVFLWVYLVIRLLNEQYDNGRIHALLRTLSELPGDLDKLYGNILTRDLQDRHELLLCLQFVLFSVRPLSPEELYFAILSRVESNTTMAWDSAQLTKEDIRRFVLSSSRGLAQVTTSDHPTVQLIHESVKDFLLKRNGLSSAQLSVDKDFVGQSHELLKQCCLAFVNSNVLANLKPLRPRPKNDEPNAEILSISKVASLTWPFVEYAASFLLNHAELAAKGGISQGNFVNTFPVHIWVSICRILGVWSPKKLISNKTTLLSKTVGDGLTCLTGLLLDGPGVDVNLKDVWDRPLIHSAIKPNNAAMLRMLLSIGKLDPDAKDRRGRTALFLAATGGFGDLVEILVKNNKTSVNLRDTNGNTPLTWAVVSGKREAVELILISGPENTNVRNNAGDTPLLLAVTHGNPEIVKLLLSSSLIEMNLRDSLGRTALRRAVDSQQLKIVRLLLETGKVDVNAVDNQGQTPLLFATSIGDTNIVELLLKLEKVDVNLKDNSGRTPISMAVEKGDTTLVKLLLNTNQVDVDSKFKFSQKPLSYHIYTGRDKVVELLLEAGKIDLSFEEEDKVRILKNMLECGRKDVFKMLLDAGIVDVHFRDDNGQTLLSYAADNHLADSFEHLFAVGNIDIDSRDRSGRTPLSYAVTKSSMTKVELLLASGNVEPDSRDEYGRTPLSYAAESGLPNYTKLLVATGKVDVESRDNLGRTPLSYAVQNQPHGQEIIKTLLDDGHVHVDSMDEDGRTPLSHGVEFRRVGIIKLLLTKGKANVESRDKIGRTPLSYAVEKSWGWEGDEIVEMLLAIGKADVNARDNSGETPLSSAIRRKYGGRKITKMLWETGEINIDTRDKNGRTILSHEAEKSNSGDSIEILLEICGANVNSRDKDGRTPLSYTAQRPYGGKPIVEAPLAIGHANVNAQDQDGRTPLSYAVERTHGTEIIKLLLATGDADINSRDKNGRTPVSYAARKSFPRTEQLEMLLATGKADLDSKCNEGLTPLDCAKKSGQKAVIDLLQSYRPPNATTESES